MYVRESACVTSPATSHYASAQFGPGCVAVIIVILSSLDGIVTGNREAEEQSDGINKSSGYITYSLDAKPSLMQSAALLEVQ